MKGKSAEEQRDLLQVGHYQVTFDEVGAQIEHSSTHARYHMQAVTATNAVDFMKHHRQLIFAMMGNYPGDLEAYRVQQQTEGRNE